ncbi:MAG: DUF4351 domain-containing protein [Magnetococcales bacterium]|nr:DUF4351 domain-containing protein [Magnetococcales bacterium]MBF0116554.1 DUF4351 domain-containing protein [Magnetococcales bacterium]
MSNTPPKTCWHCLIAATLKELLEPVGIEVRTNVPVVSLPPEADIILLQRKAGRTEEQRLLMADGLLDLDVERILAEVKVTQSLNERVFAKAYRYDDSYLEYAKLELHQLRTVIISSITPHKSLLKSCSFQPIGINGVYENQPIFGRTLRLILSNQLDNHARNAPLKCFASRIEERKKAFATLEMDGFPYVSEPFNAVVTGLRSNLMKNSLSHLDNAGLTPDSVMLVGRRMLEATIDVMPDERFFAIPKVERLLAQRLQDGESKILTRQLHRRFGFLPDWVSEKVNSATLEQIEAWSDNFVFANSLDEVFAD